jgi:hypothetical protein
MDTVDDDNSQRCYAPIYPSQLVGTTPGVSPGAESLRAEAGL